MKETHSAFKINQAVEEHLFTITPPPEARIQPVVYLIGQPGPEIQGKDLEGNQIDAAQLQGKTVVLNFWAHW